MSTANVAAPVIPADLVRFTVCKSVSNVVVLPAAVTIKVAFVPSLLDVATVTNKLGIGAYVYVSPTTNPTEPAPVVTAAAPK